LLPLCYHFPENGAYLIRRADFQFGDFGGSVSQSRKQVQTNAPPTQPCIIESEEYELPKPAMVAPIIMLANKPLTQMPIVRATCMEGHPRIRELTACESKTATGAMTAPAPK
jgi:hypothetical protein